MAFADTITARCPYKKNLSSLGAVKEALDRLGFYYVCSYYKSGVLKQIKVAPSRGRGKRRCGHPEDSTCPLDSAREGPFAGIPLGHLVFKPTGAELSVTLGYVLRGHNRFLDNCSMSSKALGYWIRAVGYSVPCLDTSRLDILSVDVTYQFRAPVSGFARKIADSILLSTKSESIFFDVKSNGVFGIRRARRAWSGYDKYKQTLDVEGEDIPELQGVYRITEKVKWGDRDWPLLFEDRLKFSQSGFLKVLSDYWDGLQVPAGALEDITPLVMKYKPHELTAALYYEEHPDHLKTVMHCLEAKPKERRNARVFYQRNLKPIIEEVCRLKSPFILSIPSFEEFNKRWKPDIFYL